jgi:hypothetical protein
MFRTLLERPDVTGAVITAEALHAQREHPTSLAGRGAHYLLIVERCSRYSDPRWPSLSACRWLEQEVDVGPRLRRVLGRIAVDLPVHPGGPPAVAGAPLPRAW